MAVDRLPPRTSARCQPYENFEDAADVSASLRACNATMRLHTSLSLVHTTERQRIRREKRPCRT